MKNLLLITILSISVLTFANNTTKSINVADNNSTTLENSSSLLVFNVQENSNEIKSTNNRLDIIKRVSVNNDFKKETMTISNNMLK